MRRLLKSLASGCLSCVAVVVTASVSLAQSQVENTAVPARNTGGWIYGLAWLLSGLAALVVLLFILRYLRYAPRFSRDEDGGRVVRADRVLPGREAPRRNVDLSQAVPIVVQPPAIPVTVPAASAPAPAAPAPAAPAPAAPAPAPAPAPPAAESAPAPAPAPAQAEEAAAPTPAPAPAPPPGEKHEVSLDQETFDKTLEELLAQGVERRIAEGKARRAAMIAARKKAAG